MRNPVRPNDILVGLGLTALVLVWGHLVPENRHLDALGITLAAAATLPTILRRRHPISMLAVHVVFSTAYNSLEYPHDALMPPALVILYTVASTGHRTRSLIATAITCATVLTIRVIDDGSFSLDTLGTLGWLLAAIVLGETTRQRAVHHDNETQRRVAEERLRIARDLHDLLAHSITTIRVQAGVAAHLVTETDQPVDRATIARTLATITDTCDTARAELRATVEVLRDPIPTLPAITDLAGPVRAAGITITFTHNGTQRPLTPDIEVAAYRIVQESLTNIVKHSNATTVTVTLDHQPSTLDITVTDNGTNATIAHTGHGLIGMTERARSVGGTLHIHTDNGFTVTAQLPAGES